MPINSLQNALGNTVQIHLLEESPSPPASAAASPENPSLFSDTAVAENGIFHSPEAKKKVEMVAAATGIQAVSRGQQVGAKEAKIKKLYGENQVHYYSNRAKAERVAASVIDDIITIGENQGYLKKTGIARFPLTGKEYKDNGEIDWKKTMSWIEGDIGLNNLKGVIVNNREEKPITEKTLNILELSPLLEQVEGKIMLEAYTSKMPTGLYLEKKIQAIIHCLGKALTPWQNQKNRALNLVFVKPK